MVCVRCGAKLGVGKLICEHCGTAVGVDERAVKNVSVRKLETGDLIYFMPEKPQAEKSAVNPAIPLESVTLPVIKNQAPPAYAPQVNSETRSESDSRKTIFKYMSESKSKLEDIKPIKELKPVLTETIIDEDSAFSSQTLDKPAEDDNDDFWGNIDEVETGLRTAAELINKGESTEEIDDANLKKEEDNSNVIEEVTDQAAAPQELLYRTEYKKSAEAMSEAPDADFEFKAPLGMKTVSPELLSLFESPKEKSMSVSEWIGTVVFLLIPGVNLIALIIWALGGCKKMQKTLFARAFLLLIVIMAAFCTLAYFIFFRGSLRLNTSLFYSARDGAAGIIQSIGGFFRGIIK